jgi:hypothetical protein
MPEGLPEHVVTFLRDCITSFEALESILVLRATAKSWSAAEITTQIHVPNERAAEALERRRKCKLVEHVPTEDPAPPDLHREHWRTSARRTISHVRSKNSAPRCSG